MALKKWILVFLITLLGCALLFAAYNYVLDPFGVFGDHFLNWYAYDMTMNPRVAKIGYLDQHYRQYDSYVIGSSKASSLPVEELNAYMDASFYNMTWYGGDLADENDLVHYLVENYHVKNIVLAVDPQNADLYNTESDPIKGNMHCKVDHSSALRFYFRYLFANPEYGYDKLTTYLQRGYLMQTDVVYLAQTGVYNKQRRDATPIGEMSEYLALERNVLQEARSSLPHIDEAIAEIADIKQVCDENGIRLLVIGVPIHNDDFTRYDPDRLATFWKELANVTDFYDFWGNNSVNGDIRYYYDTDHFRNNAGTMVLAYIFGDPDVYVPEGFGHLTTASNVDARVGSAFDLPDVDEATYTAQVPILMYHAFTDDPSAITGVKAYIGDFRDQLSALRAAGYHPIFYQDLIDYVDRGTPLPDNPILISMDDGYQSNLDLAVRVLEEENFTATIAVIGSSVGKSTYKDTGISILPHFSLESAKPYVERGILDIQTHSYDLHQVPSLDGEDCRPGVLRMEGEDEFAYVDMLTADFQRAKAQLQSVLDVSCLVYTYPHGRYDTLSEVVLHSLGLRVTVTTDPGVNVVIKGIPQSLYQLKRIDVPGGMTGDELLQTLSDYRNAINE